jgi:hypothetical protein
VFETLGLADHNQEFANVRLFQLMFEHRQGKEGTARKNRCVLKYLGISSIADGKLRRQMEQV